MSKRYELRFRRLPDGAVFDLEGRFAQTLSALVTAGHSGITALEVSSWALRLAHYTWILRHRYGLDITTEYEPHDGGSHGRYRLITPVEFLPLDDMAEAS